MKKIPALLLVFALLTGCAAGGHTYTVVQPHDEGYEVSVDSDTMTVSSYLSLKNAILRLVEEAVEEGVIRAESYSGDLGKDLSSAVYEVSRGDPLGAFAVDYMTYDYSQIVSYYEIHIHATYRRTREEIGSIENAAGTEEIRAHILEAMETYQPELRLRVGDYRLSSDPKETVEEMVAGHFVRHPEFALELPEVEVTTYPESGASRILEIRFSYGHSRETLLGRQAELEETADRLAGLYGSKNSQRISARRLLSRLIREGALTAEAKGFSDSAYGALIEGRATTKGCAMAFALLLQSAGISAGVVSGQYYEENDHVWCRMTLDGEEYMADPAQALLTGDPESAIFPADLAEELGYQVETE